MPVIACPDCGREVSTFAPACPHCGRPSPAGGAAMPAAVPSPVAEETLWKGTPSPKVLIGRVVGLIAIAIVIPVAAQWMARNTPDLDQSAQIAKIGWWITAIVFVFQLVRLGIALMRIRSTLYTVTNQRIMVENGIISKALSEIDLRTIDDTQFFQSVSARMLGIGNIMIISSDKSQPAFMLHNVENPRALRETIRSHAYAVSQRQLFTRAT
jgi:uncharacterized membrane protein YdbT with pleckstrin-like domain